MIEDEFYHGVILGAGELIITQYYTSKAYYSVMVGEFTIAQ
jgi:hypothetical protein